MTFYMLKIDVNSLVADFDTNRLLTLLGHMSVFKKKKIIAVFAFSFFAFFQMTLLGHYTNQRNSIIKELKEIELLELVLLPKNNKKNTQGFHRIFLKPQYKVYRDASILYFNALSF